MIGLIFILSFLLETCSSEGVSGCSIKTKDSKYEISSQNLFNDSLRAFYEKKWKKASEGFEVVIRCGEEQWRKRSLFMLGRTYIKMGKKEEARDLFLKSASEYEELADYSLYYLSLSLIKEREYEKANDVLRLLYKTYPGSPLRGIARFKEAEALYLSGEHKEAIRTFEVFLEENPKNPLISEAKFYKGKALKETGMVEEAVETFKRLWIDDPTSASADKVKEELVSVRLSVEEYLLRAENLFKASQYPKAIPDLRNAIELEQDPRRIKKIRLRLGIALFRTKRYDEAIDIFKKVLTIDSALNQVQGQTPDSKEALYYLTKAYLRKGSRDRFFKSSYEFYRLYPEDKKTPEVLLMLADELRISGEKEKAMDIYNLIIKEYPEKAADALYQKGWIGYLSGDFESSSKNLRLLIERHSESPRVPQALYWEARGYDKSGNSPQADALYRRIVREYPSTYYGYMAKERLRKRDETGRYKYKINENLKDPLPPRLPSVGQGSIVISDPGLDSGPFSRVRELRILGMKEEAVVELDSLRDRYSEILKQVQDHTVSSPEVLEILIRIGEAYFNLEEYRTATSLVEGNYSTLKSLNQVQGQGQTLIPVKEGTRLRYLSYPLGFLSFLRRSSNENMIDIFLLAAVIREESRFDPKAISRAGAKGLMQVIQPTWDWITNKIEIKNQKSKIKTQNTGLRAKDSFDPGENIARGSWYLRYLLDMFDQNLVIALSAYNAGPEAVNSWLRNGPKEPDEFIEEIPYAETKAYIKRVLRSYGEYRKIYDSYY